MFNLSDLSSVNWPINKAGQKKFGTEHIDMSLFLPKEWMNLCPRGVYRAGICPQFVEIKDPLLI